MRIRFWYFYGVVRDERAAKNLIREKSVKNILQWSVT